MIIFLDFFSGKKTYVYAEKCGNHLVMEIILTSHSLSVTVSGNLVCMGISCEF